jgi:hypothetical protein
MRKGPKFFTCPKCRHRYLGYDPVPDCPQCGYVYRVQEGLFRWDALVYLVVIVALISVFVMSSYYTDTVRVYRQPSAQTADDQEKLPGSQDVPFHSRYQERGR